MDNKEIMDILVNRKAVLHGHFQLTSGRHSDTYCQCARLCEYPEDTNTLAEEAVARLPKEMPLDGVIAPAVGGLVFGYAIASALNKRFIFAERVDGKMTLRRAFEVKPGERFLVAEDVVTTGGSVQEVVEVIEAADGRVEGIVSLIDRGGDKKFAKPFYPLLSLDIKSWDPQDCSLCKEGIEIYSPGSRRLNK